ncbi:phosphoadenosine phosphosulfate reductase [Nitrospirillum pindoramense]|uniref:Adenosine 5'-phosphosulfate reductase n=1 Tax=Nitrospirillum amazonense TaxID=28077 RepID=A0A560H8K1_9PROT|nr:phosphoadenylyl-sulfate reductase [Nitrospirillum amazonense]TWB42471.1 phosphoadenosine phosphosulfate reductase [Nitrospirillum amazonense]
MTGVGDRAADLARTYAGLTGPALLEPLLTRELKGEIALVSSFGAESAVLLHMVATIDPATPVLFLNTGKLFGETLRYRRELVAKLGLTDAREIKPLPEDVASRDADGLLWRTNPDACCRFRKVEPLNRALEGFGAWITGRKRFQAATRADLVTIEATEGRLKINPLADWGRDDLVAYMDRHDLPHHPLEADGYLSIGCMPCTDRVAAGEDGRSGRWAGLGKTECGIHLPLPAVAAPSA